MDEFTYKYKRKSQEPAPTTLPKRAKKKRSKDWLLMAEPKNPEKVEKHPIFSIEFPYKINKYEKKEDAIKAFENKTDGLFCFLPENNRKYFVFNKKTNEKEYLN